MADVLMFHYDSSVFRNLPAQWWNPDVSYRYVKFLPLTKFRPDAWHICNSFMIVCLILFGIFHEPRLNWYWEVLIYGCGWNLVFNVFYNKLLR